MPSVDNAKELDHRGPEALIADAMSLTAHAQALGHRWPPIRRPVNPGAAPVHLRGGTTEDWAPPLLM
jgi:hypothetical protein